MIIRHDVSDEAYLGLGVKYASSVVYVGGCAGTLIDRRWILTAAHCVINRQATLMSIRHRDSEYRIGKIELHPEYKVEPTIAHDIALIQLAEPIDDGEPAQLYPLNDENGKPVVFVGKGTFGNGRDGLAREDGKERGATNTVISTSEQLIGFRFDSPENASPTEGISGRGDSGGPAFISVGSQRYVAGVSSFQDRNGCEEGTYGVLEYYTRVSSHLGWINSVIDKTEPTMLASHPIIDAIVCDDQQKLLQALSHDVLKDAAITSEAFYQTITLNRFAMAEILFSYGAEIKSISINGASLFEYALRNHHQLYFDKLLTRFTRAENIHDEHSVVLPLLVATRGDAPDIVELASLLINQGASIDAQTQEGDSATILAGWQTDNLELIRSLVNHGADINIQNNNGDTALIDAAYLGKNAILAFLIASGADKELTNRRGLSALDMARRTDNRIAIELLVK